MKTIDVDAKELRNDMLPLSKGESAIYHLVNDIEDVVYVGQTRDLEKRIRTHLSQKKPFERVRAYKCLHMDANNMEALDIANNDARLNRMLPPNDIFLNAREVRELIAEKLMGVYFAYYVAFEADGERKSEYIRRADAIKLADTSAAFVVSYVYENLDQETIDECEKIMRNSIDEDMKPKHNKDKD